MEPFSRRKFGLTALIGSLAGLAGRAPAKAAPAAHQRSGGDSRGRFRLSSNEVAHRLEIDDLLTRYTIAVDDEQFDLLDTVFTPDAIIDYTSGGGIRGAYPEVKAWLARGLSTGNPARMHMIGNKQVTIDGISAIVRAYFFNPYTKDLPGGGIEYSLGGGFYNHKLVLTPEGWRSEELYEKRVWRQGYPAKPHPFNARSTEFWEFGGPARPKDAKP